MYQEANLLTLNQSEKVLARFFRRQMVAQLSELYQVLETQSRMSVFRRLSSVGYLSSFTHSGRYYTLSNVPLFDQFGLWFYRDVGFSRFGTLKATVVELVSNAEQGIVAVQLRAMLKQGKGNTLYNTLHELVSGQLIRVDKTAGRALYLAAETKRAAEQLKRRAEPPDQPPSLPETLSTETVILVLVEALGASAEPVDATVVSSRLRVRGVKVKSTDVEQIFAHFGLASEKKTSV